MECKLVTILVIFTTFTLSLQDTKDNEIDQDTLAEAASTLLKSDGAQQLGSMVTNFMQSEGGKQIGDMLLNTAAGGNNPATAQILEGLGSMLNQNTGGAYSGLDPSMIGNVLSFFNPDDGSHSKSDSFDFGGIFTMFANLMSQPGAPQSFADMLPSILSTFMNSGSNGPASHAGHAWFLPPIIEKAHVLFEQFIHSEMGRHMIESVGAEKFIKIFADEKGKFSFDKFVELLENQSFRRHWIQMLTKRIALIVSYVADPKTQKKYLTSIQYFVNSFLKSQGYPKAAMFDPLRPTETISAIVNHFFKTIANMKIDSKQYVRPAVEYVKDIFRLAQKRGFLMGSGVDSRALSNKLTDTINLEIIEPIARVYRAFRFIKKVPQCDRYVMCLVNQEQQDEQLSLPGLKLLLSKTFSVFSSWFISARTGTPFWTLYNVVTQDNNCQDRFLDACNDFHIEEVKVTTEYVHNEL